MKKIIISASSRIPGESLNQVIKKLLLFDVVSEYTTLTLNGNRYWGVCPFCKKKSNSFSVTPGKGVFYCFGCHKGGNVLAFIMEAEKLSFDEAAKFASEKAGVIFFTAKPDKV